MMGLRTVMALGWQSLGCWVSEMRTLGQLAQKPWGMHQSLAAAHCFGTLGFFQKNS